MTFTYADAQQAASTAGFPAADARIAAAVALAESGGNERAVSKPNANGTIDRGAWQINSVHTAILKTGDPLVLADNARMAYAVWKSQGWNAWTTYKTGAYMDKMPKDATTAAPPTTTQDTGLLAPLTNALRDATARAEMIGSAAVIILLAVVLFAIGVLILSLNTTVGKAATAFVTDAPGKVAKVASVASAVTK